MLLQNKVAVIYGAGGAIGGAIARAFGREGARLFLAGRTRSKLEALASELRARGTTVHTASVDVLQDAGVSRYVDTIVEHSGRLDISCNVVGLGDVQRPLLELDVNDFMRPVDTALRAHFSTSRAAARHMAPRGSGVLLSFGGSGPQTLPNLGGFKVALDALAGLRRQLACELGPYGIRCVTLKTGGIPESIPEGFPGRAEIEAGIVQSTLLGRAATLEDVGRVAAFVASDHAQTLTSTEINISCGAIVD